MLLLRFHKGYLNKQKTDSLVKLFKLLEFNKYLFVTGLKLGQNVGDAVESSIIGEISAFRTARER